MSFNAKKKVLSVKKCRNVLINERLNRVLFIEWKPLIENDQTNKKLI